MHKADLIRGAEYYLTDGPLLTACLYLGTEDDGSMTVQVFGTREIVNIKDVQRLIPFHERDGVYKKRQNGKMADS